MAQNSSDKIRQARQLCERGEWPDVLAFARRWQQENPADHRAHYYLGLGHSGLEEFDEAEAAYRRALALDRTDAKVWGNLAMVLYEHLDRPVEAIQCVQEALKLDPNHKVGWANLATMFGRLGHHDRAMAYADRALALDPKLVEAYLHKGTAALALGKMDAVKEVCDALANIEPERFRRAR
jgi:tetratricopeptide (TPR) repeat protein